MPLTRIDLPAGTSATYRAAVGEAVQQALHVAFGVPLEERFQSFSEHRDGTLVIHPSYLGVTRSAEAIIVEITVNEGRDAVRKASLYRALADELHRRVALRREDLVVSLVEVRRENWSFGNGEATFADGPHSCEGKEP